MSEITIHGELYSSKNSRMIVGQGRKFLIKSKNSKKQEYDFAYQLNDRANKMIWDGMTLTSRHPIKLSFKIYRQTHRRFDYTNIVQGLLDALVRAGYLPDDSADYVIPVFEQYEVDKIHPRTIMRIIP